MADWCERTGRGDRLTAQRELQHVGPPREKTGVVLDRETDRTVHLNVGRRVLERGVHRDQLCGHRVKIHALVLLGLNETGKNQLTQRSLGAYRHVGTQVFDGLEGPDGLAELLPVCRILHRHIAGCLGDADAIGTVATYTVDRLSYSPSPPVVFAVVDFDGGGRLPLELTDIDAVDVHIGDRVEMTFRKLFTADGINNYFWKARPVRS